MNMNINNITFESFKEIYEYLVYKRQNINKFIQNNEDYTNFMNNLQKKYASIEDTDDYLYYHKLISNMEKQFMCKKTKVDLNLQKINLIIDTFDTFEKICHYEQTVTKLKEQLKNSFDTTIKQEIEKINKTKICSPDKYSMLIPVSIISDKNKKDAYLKDNYLIHRLTENLTRLLGISNIESLTLIKNKRKKFFNFFKKEYYNKDELISKKNKYIKEQQILYQIENFLCSYNETTYFCPFCSFNSSNEFEVGLHHHTKHCDIINICPTVCSGYTQISMDNLIKCPYCPKEFEKSDSCNVLYHIKINHLFETDKIKTVSKYVMKEKPKKIISTFKKTTRKKYQIDPEVYFGIVDKLEHEYNKLFRKPNPCLIKELIEDEIEEMLDEKIDGNQLHLSIDTALQYSEHILYTKLFKLIRKSLGKNLFKKAGIQKDFGYEDGIMTIENEVDAILVFIKEQLSNVLIENLYGNNLSKHNQINKEFTDNFENLIETFSRYLDRMNYFQEQLQNCEEDELKMLEEKFEKVYVNLQKETKIMKNNLSFLFKFIKLIGKIPDIKNPDNITDLIENLILPDKNYNIKVDDHYDENKEEVDFKSFFLLFSYLDKSESSYIVDGIFNNIITSENIPNLLEKPYVWTWKYGNFVDEEFEDNSELYLEKIKEYKDCFLNFFTKFNKNIKENIEDNVTDFDYLISNINEMKDFDEIDRIYGKFKEILRLFTDMNTNSIIKVDNKQYETINTFTRQRYKYFNDDNELVCASNSDVDSNLSKLLRMRKMILHQKLNLTIVLALIHKFLVKSLDEEYMANGYEQKSFSLFFKRYFQLMSFIMSRNACKNKLPSFQKSFKKKSTIHFDPVKTETEQEKPIENLYEIDEDPLLSDDSDFGLNECIIENDFQDDEENMCEDYDDSQEFGNEENFEENFE